MGMKKKTVTSSFFSFYFMYLPVNISSANTRALLVDCVIVDDDIIMKGREETNHSPTNFK
jgi:hypothetical protein